MFDKEIASFNKRWRRFQRNIINLQVADMTPELLNTIIPEEVSASKYAANNSIEDKIIGRFSRVNYE